MATKGRANITDKIETPRAAGGFLGHQRAGLLVQGSGGSSCRVQISNGDAWIRRGTAN